MDKGLPNNIEAEKGLIGSVFWSYASLQKACEEVDKDVFFLDSNAKIFETIKDLYDKKEPVDVTTVTTELVRKNLINSIGGVEYLNEVVNSVATGANIEYYINVVLEKYTLRRMIEVATNIVKISSQDDVVVSDIVEQAEKNILNDAKSTKTSEFRKVQDVITKAQEDLEQLAKNKGKVTGLTTGLGDLDRLTEGLVILARSKEISKKFEEYFRLRKIDKFYQAYVDGNVSNEGIKKAYLYKDSKQSTVTISATPKDDYKEIITEFHIVHQNPTNTLLDIKLHTGRTHQIRSHLSFLGHPIINDTKYGKRTTQITEYKGYCLTAYKLKFNLNDDLAYLNDLTIEISPSWLQYVK